MLTLVQLHKPYRTYETKHRVHIVPRILLPVDFFYVQKNVLIVVYFKCGAVFAVNSCNVYLYKHIELDYCPFYDVRRSYL
jgi:hypothetical protein